MPSRVGVARAALKAAVVTQLVTDGVAGVDVRLFPPVGTVVKQSRLFFDTARPDQEHFAHGGSRMENIELDGNITVLVSGVSETEQTQAEDRALAILASLETVLVADDDLGGAVWHAELVDYEIAPQVTAGNDAATEITFTVSIQSII